VFLFAVPAGKFTIMREVLGAQGRIPCCLPDASFRCGENENVVHTVYSSEIDLLLDRNYSVEDDEHCINLIVNVTGVVYCMCDHSYGTDSYKIEPITGNF